MLSVKIDSDIEKSLKEIARATRRSKSDLIREALARYVEDSLDYLSAVAAMKKIQAIYSLNEVLEEFKDEI